MPGSAKGGPTADRRSVLALLGAGPFCLALSAGGAAAAPAPDDGKPLTIRMGQGDKAMSSVVIARLIPEYLGYYRQEGLKGEVLSLGSNAAVMAGLHSGRLEFGQGTAQDQLLRMSRGETLPGINFFEHVYPFKYAFAVRPGSPLKTLQDLRGKRIGLSSFGNSTSNVARRVLTFLHIDPDKDVSWLAVGEGISSGVALARGDVDALVYDDVGFGQLEAARIKLRYLPLPANLPKIGGTFLSTTPEMLKDHRQVAVGMARAILKGEIFIQENPAAACYIFLKMAPEVAPHDLPLKDQIHEIEVAVRKRAPLYSPYDKTKKWGYMSAREWQDEIDFAGVRGKITDAQLAALYTNALIDDINDFDWDKVRHDARNFKIPA
ncbi:MAG TPA: ABC transporter substrate-binding protein [Stellaceae bacterium]|nr:ABC transporter substrate-binding protein [Stellaceae bacterium]